MKAGIHMAFAAAALAGLAALGGDGRGPGGENIRRKAWTRTPEAEALLVQWRE